MKTIFFTLKNYLICKASGADSQRYLKGRITQEISSLSENEIRGSLLLTPQGKILSAFDIAKVSDHYLLVVDSNEQEEFSDSLLRFKVADDIELEFKQQNFEIVSVQGKDSLKCLQSLVDCELSDDSRKIYSTKIGDIAVQIMNKKRSPQGGFDILLSKEKYSDLIEILSKIEHLDQANTEMSEVLRISAGAPKMEADLIHNIVATEIPHKDLISFTKGCYAGQETVEMSIARGRPNRTLTTLSCKGQQTFEAKTPLLQNDKKAGFITSSVFIESEDLTIILAFVKTALLDTPANLSLTAKEQELSLYNS